MFAYINDLTAYLIIKEVAAAINSDGANKRSAESVRTSTLTTRDIIQSIIEAIPDVAKLIKETRAAQQPAIPNKDTGAVVEKFTLPKRLIQDIIWRFLGDNLTPDQLGTVGKWLSDNKASDPNPEKRRTHPAEPTEPENEPES